MALVGRPSPSSIRSCGTGTASLSYQAARLAGLSDASLRRVVERLDRRVAEVAGRGFAVTPGRAHGDLEARLGVGGAGALWVKDETGNVSGSHKARHLFGVLLWLELAALAREAGLPSPAPSGRFAIASCGNAALAAAVVAAAAGGRSTSSCPPT
jgi:threonine synthase